MKTFKILPIVILTALITAPALRGEETLQPISIRKWFIAWDRLTRSTLVECALRNGSREQLSGVTVEMEFVNDKGDIVRRSHPWRAERVPAKGAAKMRMTVPGCPSFERYKISMAGKVNREDFEQLFEGTYWPEKPGATPAPPKPVVYAKGSADVRVVGSREEHIKGRGKKEGLAVSGKVKNVGDCPAEDISLELTFVTGKRTVHTDKVSVQTSKLMPGKSTDFRKIYPRVPPYTALHYKVNFKSIEPGEGNNSTNSEAFDVEASPIAVKNCRIENGLFTGTLVNIGTETVREVVIRILMVKGDETETYKIEPGGDITPGFTTELIKATTPDFDNFSVDIQFKEK